MRAGSARQVALAGCWPTVGEVDFSCSRGTCDAGTRIEGFVFWLLLALPEPDGLLSHLPQAGRCPMQSVQSRTNALAWTQDETGRHGDLISQMSETWFSGAGLYLRA